MAVGCLRHVYICSAIAWHGRAFVQICTADRFPGTLDKRIRQAPPSLILL